MAPPTVSSTFGFNGIAQSGAGGSYPSDSNGAVSASQLALIVNQALVTYSKTGTQTSDRTLATISGYTTTGLFDPRIIYDPEWHRFVITLDSFPQNSSTQELLILISKSGSASGSYLVYQDNVAPLCGNSSQSPFWDYPQVGMTQDAIVTTANCFQGNSYVGARFFAVAKALLYNGFGYSVPVFFPSSSDGTVTPALVYDQRPAMELLSTSQHMLTFQDPQAGGYGSFPSDTAITGFEPYAVPRLAGQAGCTTTSCELDTSDGRFVNDSYQFGDQLWNVATYGLGGTNGSFATPYWGQFSIAGSSTTQFGDVFADSCSDDWNASLAVTTGDHMVINWNSSDPDNGCTTATFVRQMEAGRTSATASGGVDNIVNPFTSSAELTGDFDSGRGYQRWGDTSSTNLDPSSVSTFWSFNNSVADTNDWGTRIQKIKN